MVPLESLEKRTQQQLHTLKAKKENEGRYQMSKTLLLPSRHIYSGGEISSYSSKPTKEL